MGTDHASAVTYAVHGTLRDPAEWIGRVLESDAPYPVEAGRVADFCALVEDPNPLYWDEAAATARFGAPIAPPGTLMVWRIPPPWHPAGRPEHGFLYGMEIPLDADTAINVSTDMWLEGPIFIGDRLRYREEIVGLSDEKATALGPGWFITTDTTVTAAGRPVGRYRNVLLRYRRIDRSPAQPSLTASSTGSSPAGDLPEVLFPITASTCALVPAGTRDGFPGHHDRDVARAQGIADCYVNTMFFHGLIDRLALCWAGPDAAIVRRNLAMRQSAVVGDTLRVGGRVLRNAQSGDLSDLAVFVVTTDGAPVATSELTVNPKGWPS